MEEIINTFHVDWHIILAQLVNFALVVAVLWYFAFRPLAKTMTERTTRIEQSLKNADAVEERLRQADAEYQVMLTNAKKDAEQIIVKAKTLAEQQRVEVVEKTKAEAAKIVESGKQQLAAQREQMVASTRVELSELVALATEKVIGEKITTERDRALVERAVKEAKL